MSQIPPERYYKEEKANAIIHGLGVVLSILGIPFLLKVALTADSSQRQVWGVALFGFSMFILYLASTIYHSVHRPGPKRLCRKIDHVAIYFLIAGTHTPFIIRYMDNPKGWIYLATLWGLLLIGALGKLFFIGKWEKLSLLLYLFMGWMFVFILPDVWPLMGWKVLAWIGIGGFFYTSGVIFYTRKKMRYSHAYWHIFVLAGTAGHYIAVLQAFGA